MSEEEIQEITYVPLSAEEVGADEMFSQGASALDLAAIFAIERRDHESLTAIAREWIRMGKAISGMEVVPEDKKTKLKFGFNKEVEEEENGKDGSKSDGEDDIQSGGRLYPYRIRGQGPRS